MAQTLNRLDRKKLRGGLLLFFIALALPTAVLIYQAFSQLKWEAFHQHQLQAEALSTRIDDRFMTLVDREEAHAFTDFSFLVVAGDPAANFLQRSPLSAYPPNSALPGLIGYFQVDARGEFSTPLLPTQAVRTEEVGIPATELVQRQALAERIYGILSDNKLVQGKPDATHLSAAQPLQKRDEGSIEEKDATANQFEVGEALSPIVDNRQRSGEQEAYSQSVFDRLKAPGAQRLQKKGQSAGNIQSRVEDLQLETPYPSDRSDEPQATTDTQKAPKAEKRPRKERGYLPQIKQENREPAYTAERTTTVNAAQDNKARNIDIFESEVDPFEFSPLDSGHFVLFRKVWRNGQRHIQGVLLEQTSFLNGVVRTAFENTVLLDMSDLIAAYQGEVLTSLKGRQSRDYLSRDEPLSGALLYRTHLSAPLNEMELIFTITRLPPGPGSSLISWIAVILVTVLCGGFYLLYRLGAGQIELARQQQDFVSAVSHELKTPLTSIRMYGEMLREGWASEDKKKGYYDFIFEESERLSRLIGNVLQLARMSRNELQVDIRPVSVGTLIDSISSKISTQMERAGFELKMDCNDRLKTLSVDVDTDAFTQIVINLVDNALKFSAKAENKCIDIGCQELQGGHLQFSVRDYGPGVNRDQMKKIFRLFYRAENELTRETVGTGIGLALVNQLAQKMRARVDVVQKTPGVEFRIIFPLSRRPAA